MKRSANPFDVFVGEDTLGTSKNNPFLKEVPEALATSAAPSLENRLARLKEEMKEYEHRMSTSWQPPTTNRQAEITRLQADLERRRQLLRSEGVRSPLFRSRPNHHPADSLESLEGEYLQRLDFMRTSLETKKREINSALSGSFHYSRSSEVPIGWRPNQLSGLHRHCETRDMDFKLQPVETDKDSELEALRAEQVHMKAEMAELRARLAELERRSVVPPFGMADGEQERVRDPKETLEAPFPRSQRTNSQPLS